MQNTPMHLKVIARTILTFAVFHLCYLAVSAVILKDWTLLSLFSIMDFQLFWPGIDLGLRNAVLGVFVIAAVMYVSYHSIKRESASS